MKILYASCRYDPLDRDAGSGVDFNVYQALKEQGADLQIIGPFKDVPSRIERVYRKVHRLFSRKMTAKFSETYLHSCAIEVEKAAREYQPDAIFSHNLIPLVYINTTFPIIHKSDAILKNMHEQWPTYSKLEFLRMLTWEKKALKKCALVITASQWAEQPLLKYYGISPSRLMTIPIPSSLPATVIPDDLEEQPLRDDDVHLLTVAKDYDLKGVDIAMQVTRIIRQQGVNAELRVVGQQGENVEGVQFMGLYKKNDPAQLDDYISHYQWAHFLIHPARYEAAGIVCSEAAAFGVPAVTNSAGGLATTVANGISGVVLPKGSPAEAYVDVIASYIKEPDRYANLRKTTRARYETDLNWNSAGRRILAGIQRVLSL